MCVVKAVNACRFRGTKGAEIEGLIQRYERLTGRERVTKQIGFYAE